jgi:hypothetical protein
MAVVRCAGSRNIVLISASVEGMRVAPAIPSSARAAISVSAVGAYAATTDATANAAPPMSSSLRRPMRSPIEPIVTRKPAMRKP